MSRKVATTVKSAKPAPKVESKLNFAYPRCKFDFSTAGFEYDATTSRRISPVVKAIISSFPSDNINDAIKCNLAANIMYDLLITCGITYKNEVNGRYDKPKLIKSKDCSKYVSSLLKNNTAKYEHIIKVKKITDLDLKSFVKDVVNVYIKSCDDEHKTTYEFIKSNRKTRTPKTKSTAKSTVPVVEDEIEYEYYDE